MGGGPLIGLMDNPEYGNMTQHQHEGGERHYYWKKGHRHFALTSTLHRLSHLPGPILEV
jgi:hypothetical protein